MAQTDGKAEVQHYVPRMLLRNFSIRGNGKQEQIYVFDKHSNRCFRTGLGNVVAERGFYDISVGEARASLEPSLSELEGKTASAFAKLLEHRQLNVLSKEDRTWIGVFLASQHVRVANFREVVRDMQAQLAGKIGKMGYHPAEVEGFSDLSEEQDLKLFSTLFLIKSVPDFAPLMLNKVWVLLETENSNPFWISDNPLTLHNEEDLGPYGNIGFAVPGIQIYLPLSPTLTLGLWCQTLAEKFRDGWEKSRQMHQTLRVQRLLGANPNVVEIDEGLQKLEASMSSLGPAVQALADGVPMKCDDENVMFLNSLQTRWANRFVLSRKNEFGLVRRMLKEFPNSRRGVRMEVN